MNFSSISDVPSAGLKSQNFQSVKATTKKFTKYLLRSLPYSLFILLVLYSSTVFSGTFSSAGVTPDCFVTGTGTTTPVCAGSFNGTATITLSGEGSGAPGTYTIDGGSAQSFSSNPFTISGLAAGNHTIVATVTASGCVSSNILITVGTSQLPTITASASPATICNGTSSTLTATGASTYIWNPGSLSGSSVSVSPTTTTTYTVTGTSAAGCVGGNIWASISAGGSHNLGIKTDGTLWAWGDNLYGQLGDGTNGAPNLKKSPVQIGSATNWAIVSAGNNHSLAIKADGTLWAWGYNGFGLLGDGTIIDKNVPVQIGIATNWSAISAAGSHSIALRTNGTLWAWGYNNYGQLGDGTFTQRNAPVQIGVATNWASISAASDHSTAIKTDGTLWSWGRNTFGQLGDGTINSKNAPGQVGVASDWAKVNACYYHNLAIKTNGSLWAWGYNNFSQIGDGTTTQRNSPVQIGVATDWSGIEGGLYHSLAMKTNGTAWAWGYNVYGQLGDGTQTNRSSPVQSGVATNWGAVSAGIYHSIGLRTIGSLYGWGYNNVGQLGDGTMFLRTSPTQSGSTVVSVIITVNPLPTVSFSGLAGSYCLTAPSVTLTGSPAGGTFSGPGISSNTFTPATAGVGTHNITYSYTDINGCSNTSTQSVSVVFSNALDYVNLQFPGTASFCQGGSLTVYGQLYEPGLTEAAGPGGGVTAELGYSLTNSNPATWINWQPAGFNVQVGNNDEYSSTLTLPAGTYYYAFRYTYTLNTCGYQYGGYSAGGGNAWDGVTNISGVLTVNSLPTVTVSGNLSVCNGSSTTLTASGASTYIWMPGSLSGTSITVSPTTNTTYTVTGTSAAGCVGANSWASYSTGSYHNLGFKTNGTMWASGQNLYGQIGDGTLADKPNPIQIGPANTWSSVSAGGFHTIGIKADGTLWAWGSNSNGQLGDGTLVDKTSPVQIGTATNWSAVAAGGSHSLAMKTDGTLWGWGRNDYGQVGDGSFTQRTSPAQAGTATNWVSFSAGGSHSVGIKNNGTMWTWGRNSFGQLGDGTTALKNVPTQMGVATNWKKIAAGFFHTIAVKADGTLWTWGYNLFGQLGDGTTTDKLSPLQIGSATTWSNVRGGLYHCLALRTNGTLWAWGANNYGQLGDGSTVQRTSPVQIGSVTTWMSIDAGAYHSSGIRSNGSLWAWGRNMEGQLGDGNTLVLAQINPIQIGSTNVSVTVTVNPLPVVSFSGLAANYCVNSSAATLTGSPSGGTFSGPGISGNIFDPAVAGVGGPYAITYSFTNGNGCTNTATQNVTVSGFAGGSVSFSGLAGPYCTTASPITLTGNQAGGTFSGPGITDNGNGTASFNPAAAGSGTHNITYTYSNGTCSSSATQTVTVLPNYTITASAGADGTISPNGSSLICSGNNQAYTMTANAGFHIADVLVDGNSVGPVSVYTFTNITAGHTISVSFAMDCAAPSLSTVITQVACNGGDDGAVDLVLTGGSSPFTYSWTGPGGFTASSEDIAGLVAGNYNVTVTATGGCTTSASYAVNQPDPLMLSCNGTNITCNAANNGTASVNVTGGTGIYTYSWTDGTSTSGSVSINASKDNNIYANSTTNSNALGGNLAIGNSNSGATHRALMAFDISGNIPAGAVINSTTLTMNVSASAPGSGLQPIYLHKLTSDWGEGTSFTPSSGVGTAATLNDATWADRFYPSTPWNSAGGDFDAIASAVTDVNTPAFYTWSSAGMASNIQQWLNNPASNKGWLIKGIESAPSQSKRFDSRENSSVANRPVLTVNYTSPNIIGTSNTLSSLPPGTYTVTVTDANGCSATCTYTVTEPDPITVTATPGTINCNGGTTSVTVSATGGSGNYTTGTGVFNNVGAGTHTYIVTDDNGCTGSASITINEPTPIVVSFSGLAATYCTTDASVTLTGSPAGGIFSGPGMSGNSFDPATAGVGTHTITYNYTNLNGCSNSASQQVTVNTCAGSIALNLKVYLQGYYIDGGIMQPVLNNQSVLNSLATETDSITVALHDPITFALVDSKMAVLLTTGGVSATFTQPAGSYYIAIKHRNTIQTWSANPVACSVVTPLYDFSVAASKAMGGNQVEVQTGIWAFFTGDLNQDEFIDGNDFPAFDTDSFNGVNSVYVATDMNGDGFVDGNDFPVFDNNSFNGVSSIHP